MVRVRLSGDAYNRKTLNRVKKSLPKPQVGVCEWVLIGSVGAVWVFKFKIPPTKEDRCFRIEIELSNIPSLLMGSLVTMGNLYSLTR